MKSSVADALFWPVTAGLLPPPGPDARVLYMNARTASVLPVLIGTGHWTLIQPFAPWAASLPGCTVLPEPGTGAFDYVFVAGVKQADERRGLLADALLRLDPGGWLVAAGAGNEGGKRLVQDCALLGLEGDETSKHHARVFWARKGQAVDGILLQDWVGQAALQFCKETGFYTCPGLFSWDRIDAGSGLLADRIKGRLSGKGADFGCGYGYLSRAIIGENRTVTALTCLDADMRAVRACARNMAGAAVPVACVQADLTQAVTLLNLDWIVMNPPFHEGRVTDSTIGAAFIKTAARALRPGGTLYMVANNRLPYEPVLAACFTAVTKPIEKDDFKIIEAVKAGRA